MKQGDFVYNSMSQKSAALVFEIAIEFFFFDITQINGSCEQ